MNFDCSALVNKNIVYFQPLFPSFGMRSFDRVLDYFCGGERELDQERPYFVGILLSGE